MNKPIILLFMHIMLSTLFGATAPASTIVPTTTREPPPDVTVGYFWQDRVVYLAELTDVGVLNSTLMLGGGKSMPVSFPTTISYKITEVIAGKPSAKTKTLATSKWYFWVQDPQKPYLTSLHPGDTVIVFEAKTDPTPLPRNQAPDLKEFFIRVLDQRGITVVKPVNSPANDPLVQSARQIAAILATDNLEKLLEGAIGDDDLTAKVCLQLFLKLPETPTIPGNYTKKLTAIANDTKREANLRLLASQGAAKLANVSDPTVEFAWLKNAITADTSNNDAQLRPWVQRLLVLTDQRNQTVDFLADILSAAKANVLWSLVASYLDDPQLFNYKNPDMVSEKIFSAYLGLLKDSRAPVQTQAAMRLVEITSRLATSAPTQRAAFQQRAVQAIQDAYDKGKNPQLYNKLQDFNNIDALNQGGLESVPPYRHPPASSSSP
jgi:hypothetical protein